MDKINMVDIDKQYVRQKVKESGMSYVNLSKIIGMPNKGSLTGMISAERLRLEYLQKIARICDFPYKDAIKSSKPKAYIKKSPMNVCIDAELNKIIDMQKQINDSLIKILKQCEERKWHKK